jgi:motility quorum-sensing regulator/GCU-specific mRNA interferase toxin
LLPIFLTSEWKIGPRLGAAAFTKTALDGGRSMGLTTAEMLAVIASLSRREFYKS